MFLKLKHKRKQLILTGDTASVDRFNTLLTARNKNKSLVATIDYTKAVTLSYTDTIDYSKVSLIRIIDPKEWDISLHPDKVYGDGIITTLTSSL